VPGTNAVTWPPPEVNVLKKISAVFHPSHFKSSQSPISPQSSSGQKVTSALKSGSRSSTPVVTANEWSTGFVCPLQIKAMHGQKASPASNLGVLVSRVGGQNPKSASDQATQIHANLKKQQHVSPFS
jgi:hypothetical protein